MSQAILGKSMLLSAIMKRNRFPWIGQNVSVRVIKTDGTELLAATVVPEIAEPGVYSFEWLDPPKELITVFAIYTVKTRCYTEEIRIVREDNGESLSRFKATLRKRPQLGAAIDTSQIISTELNDRQSIAANIENKGLEAEIKRLRISATLTRDC